MKSRPAVFGGATLAAVALLLAFAPPVETAILATTTANRLGDRPETSLDDLWPLAIRFAPVLVFEANESYFPIDPQAMLDNSELQYNGNTVRSPPIGQEDLAAFNYSTAYLRLALRNISALALYESIRPHYATPVFVQVSTNGTGWVFLQYWVFYLADEAINAHEGDWEMIQVNLRPGGLPNTFGYSQHLTGRARHWWNVSHEGFHPVAFIGNGSHAAYFSSGHHDLAFDRCGPTGLDSTSGGIRLEAGAGYTLVPFSDQPWLLFAGHWGNVTGNPGGDGPPGPWYRTNGCSTRLYDPLPWYLTLTQERTGPWPAYHP